MSRKLLVFVAVVLFLVTLNSVVFPLDDKLSRSSLRGIKGVYVLIEKLSPDTESDRLSTSQLQTDVEQRFREARIKVQTKEAYLKTPGTPYFYVQVNTMKNGPIYAYSINIELKQWVLLSRNTKIQVLSPTWSHSMIGTVGVENLSMLREGVRKEVDQFINAYLSVNPKK